MPTGLDSHSMQFIGDNFFLNGKAGVDSKINAVYSHRHSGLWGSAKETWKNGESNVAQEYTMLLCCIIDCKG